MYFISSICSILYNFVSNKFNCRLICSIVLYKILCYRQQIGVSLLSLIKPSLQAQEFKISVKLYFKTTTSLKILSPRWSGHTVHHLQFLCDFIDSCTNMIHISITQEIVNEYSNCNSSSSKYSLRVHSRDIQFRCS